MKKFYLSAFVILAFGIYAIYQRHSPSSRVILPPPTLQTQTVSEAPINVPVEKTPTRSSSTNTPTPNNSSSMMGGSQMMGYRNGTYTGSSADAYYGNVQVKATIQSGKITDVTFLDYPHDRSTSASINSQAMPYLKQEAIQAQSANVNIISGATMTSEAFIQSLGSALSQAKN